MNYIDVEADFLWFVSLFSLSDAALMFLLDSNILKSFITQSFGWHDRVVDSDNSCKILPFLTVTGYRRKTKTIYTSY